MATDLERMVVSLEASITKYERAMNKAVGEARSTSSKIEKEFDGLDKKLAGMFKGGLGGFTKGLVSGVAGFLSLERVIDSTNNALEKFGNIADLSARAGLDPEFFQALAHQASLAGVSIDELGGAFSTFAKNVGLAASGKGKLLASLKELDPELLKNIEASGNQEQRIRAVIAALQDTSSAAQRVAIATAAFGDAGAGIAAAFGDGAKSVDQMVQNARDLGVVVDRDLIAKADEYGDQWDTVREIIGVKINKALVDLAPLMIELVGSASDFAGWFKDAYDWLNHINDQTIEMGARARLERGLGDLRMEQGVDFTAGMLPPATGLPAGAGTQDDIGGGATSGNLTDFINSARTRIPEVTKSTDDLAASAGDAATATTDLGDGLQWTNTSAAAAQKKIKDMIADLEHENETLGMTAVQQQVSNALYKAGADATDAQKKKIEELVTAHYYEEQQITALKDAYAQLWDIGESALNGLVNAMADGTIEGNELLSVIADIAKQLGNLFIKNAFSSMSGGGGFDFASLLTGRAEGGPVEAGQPYVVGERRPELFVPRTAGFIIPRVPAASGGVTNITIDARGAQMGVAEQIAAAFDRFERFRMPGKVRQINRDPYAVGG